MRCDKNIHCFIMNKISLKKEGILNACNKKYYRNIENHMQNDHKRIKESFIRADCWYKNCDE